MPTFPQIPDQEWGEAAAKRPPPPQDEDHSDYCQEVPLRWKLKGLCRFYLIQFKNLRRKETQNREVPPSDQARTAHRIFSDPVRSTHKILHQFAAPWTRPCFTVKSQKEVSCCNLKSTLLSIDFKCGQNALDIDLKHIAQCCLHPSVKTNQNPRFYFPKGRGSKFCVGNSPRATKWLRLWLTPDLLHRFDWNFRAFFLSAKMNVIR